MFETKKKEAYQKGIGLQRDAKSLKGVKKNLSVRITAKP